MKILHCIYDHTANPWVAGGGAFRVREIYRRFTSLHEITVRCGRYPGARDYQDHNIRYEFEGTVKNNYLLSTLCYVMRMTAYLRVNFSAYDVVVEDFAPYNPVFSFLWRKDAVIQLHQREGLRHLKKYAFLGIPIYLMEKFYHRFFKNAVTISEMSREKYGLRGAVAVIPNGFDGTLLDFEAEEEDYMLFLGRLHIGQKGLDTLSIALGLTNCRIVIAGAGKDEDRVRRLFSKAMRSGQAQCAGFVSGQEKITLLGKCLFMVVPSRYEGQPLAVIEAAACGKPVIVSDIPELRYTVDAGFGISFKSDDAEDLAEKINILYKNPELRQAMGKKAREYAKRFTWESIAKEYEAYLSGVRTGNSGVER